MRPVARKHRKAIGGILAFVLAALVLWICWANTALEVNTYVVTSEKLPSDFSGFRIVHVSDLHNVQIGPSNSKLLTAIADAQPDVICITGDLIDSRSTDLKVALDFAQKAVAIAPCYYVSGNHEARIAEYDSLKAQLLALGVAVLEDSSVVLTAGSSSIYIWGVDDPSFETDYLLGDSEAVMGSKLQDLAADSSRFQILLSHRPELFTEYKQEKIDLVLSGHAHGGQFRLPLIGGLYAPHQGFLPEYDAGHYQDGDTQMIVSRGIGNSLFPFRLNNRPEIILIELSPQ